LTVDYNQFTIIEYINLAKISRESMSSLHNPNRGSPNLTVSMTEPTPLSISTIHAVVSFSSNFNFTKFTFHLTMIKHGSLALIRFLACQAELILRSLLNHFPA